MTGDGNWTWLLMGRVPTLVDAGVGDARHLDDLGRALEHVTLAQVLLTHAHTDHASGAPALAAAHPEARFRKRPWPGRDEKWPAPYQPIADGDVVEAGDTRLTAIHTPGHAPDHLCFWHEETRTVFGGDLVIKGTTVYIPTSLGGDLAAYLASLARIRSLRPTRILPAHGPVVNDPERVIDEYVAHRLEREAQVLAALADGSATADAMVAKLYRGLSDRMRQLASETVLAHLLKLEAERRVGHDEDRWHIMAP
jgi:glyoxylase-like metal-dependent hydrolase (beta-lactamase superfamily II)